MKVQAQKRVFFIAIAALVGLILAAICISACTSQTQQPSKLTVVLTSSSEVDEVSEHKVELSLYEGDVTEKLTDAQALRTEEVVCPATFSFENIAQGTYTVAAKDPETSEVYISQLVEVGAEEAELTFILNPTSHEITVGSENTTQNPENSASTANENKENQDGEKTNSPDATGAAITSGSEQSPQQNTGGTQVGSQTPQSPSTPNNPSQPSQPSGSSSQPPAHVHNWVAQYVTEQTALYQTVSVIICNDCGAVVTDANHEYQHIVNDGVSHGTHNEYRRELVGYETQETLTGHICSGCGAHQ